MINTDEKSNAQSWELEVTCKNKEYLKEIVSVILSYGMINFQVENVEFHNYDDSFEARYLVLMWGSWFHILGNISKELSEIEDKFENLKTSVNA
jgi:hypothetical protein